MGNAQSLLADWYWPNDIADVKISPHWYEAHFSFENSSNASVTVSGVRFSCSCINYHFTSKPAKAGQTGCLTIWIRREGNAATESEFQLIAFGSSSLTPKELTARVGQ